jgi:hypothetical protein
MSSEFISQRYYVTSPGPKSGLQTRGIFMKNPPQGRVHKINLYFYYPTPQNSPALIF